MHAMIAAMGTMLLAGSAMAQVAPGTPGVADQAARDAASRAAYETMPDTQGTGPYPAIKEMDPTLPEHVVYRPRDLTALHGRKLGVLVWGNGGCSDNGASARQHLTQIASYGYVVIAPGRIYSGPGAAPRPERPAAQQGLGVSNSYHDVLAGVDWAIAENSRKGSPYYGRIATSQIAVSGHSCGGLQAIQAGADPRIKTVIIHNSGVFTDGTNPIRGITIAKSELLKLHTPVLYVLGGHLDVAWVNGSDDYARITHVPIALLDAPVGHGGTFREPYGGDAAVFDVNWLNWQLRGDREAAKMFTGADCGLCRNSKWKLERKGL